MTTQAREGRTEELDAAIRSIGEGAAQRDFNDENPFAAVDIARKARIGALRLPVEMGGYGMSIREMFATIIDLAEADPAVAHIVRTHYWIVEERLHSADRKGRERWLGEIGRGAIFGNASSELGAGAVGSLRYATTLTPTAEGFLLTGKKYYSTGALFADWISVWAMRDENTLAAVIVPANRAGITMHDDWDGIGIRKTGSGTTVLDHVVVHADELVAEYALDRPAVPTYEFAFLQLYLQALMAGVLRNVVADGIGLLRGRERSFAHAPTPRPVDDPILQQILGQLSAAGFAAESTVLAAADALDAAYNSATDGAPDAALAQTAMLRASQAKVHVDELATKAASLVFDLGGASAATRRKNLDRHWRGIRTLTLHNPALYKAQAIGKYLVHDEPFPANGYF